MLILNTSDSVLNFCYGYAMIVGLLNKNHRMFWIMSVKILPVCPRTQMSANKEKMIFKLVDLASFARSKHQQQLLLLEPSLWVYFRAAVHTHTHGCVLLPAHTSATHSSQMVLLGKPVSRRSRGGSSAHNLRLDAYFTFPQPTKWVGGHRHKVYTPNSLLSVKCYFIVRIKSKKERQF